MQWAIAYKMYLEVFIALVCTDHGNNNKLGPFNPNELKQSITFYPGYFCIRVRSVSCFSEQYFLGISELLSAFIM